MSDFITKLDKPHPYPNPLLPLPQKKKKSKQTPPPKEKPKPLKFGRDRDGEYKSRQSRTDRAEEVCYEPLFAQLLIQFPPLSYTKGERD